MAQKFVHRAIDTGLPASAADAYGRLEPPLDPEESPEVTTADRAAAAYLWQAGSYRCGITAYLIFFLLGDFVEHAARMRPRRFGALVPFARSFDYTDHFIKRVTDSGRRPSGGITDPAVRAELRHIQSRHDRIHVPHWMMVHFGFTLIEQVEADLDERDPAVLSHHLRYMSQAFRAMGIPFTDERETLVTLCRTIEAAHARWTPEARAFGPRLLFLGQLMGVRSRLAHLAPLMPAAVRPLLERHWDQLRPHPLTRGVGGGMAPFIFPVRRWRNPRPSERPACASPS